MTFAEILARYQTARVADALGAIDAALQETLKALAAKEDPGLPQRDEPPSED